MWRKGRLKRFRKIINTMAKYGFGQLIHDLGIEELARHLSYPLHKKNTKGSHLSKAQRFRMAMEELGPTFIKFGQLLSTRPGILPEDYLIELRRLQDNVQPFSGNLARKVIEKELNLPLDSLFESFDETPLAAASIGQVHKAVLPGGKKVVVKVQRPNIIKTIEQDLGILEEIAGLLDKYTTAGRLYNFTGIVSEFKRITLRELNYHREARNAERLYSNFLHDNSILIPAIYWNYTTPRVLTMEYMQGVTLNNKEGLNKGNFNKRVIVEELSRAYLKQILTDGFFHGDPHPGNIGVLQGEKIYFLDFGVVGSLTDGQRQTIGQLLTGFITGNSGQVLSSIIKLGIVTDKTDKKELKRELERLQEKYYNCPLKEIQIGKLLYELMEISYRQQMHFPAELTILAKTFFTLEGLISELEPDFSVAEILQPFGEEFLRDKFSKRKIAASFFKNLLNFKHLLEIFPEYLGAILEKGASNSVKIKIEVIEIDKVLHRFNNMINRLSFSIVLASIIVGLCFMVRSAEYSLFRAFPIAEIGLILAAAMGFWWLWAIVRSGRL